eukprot:TRINITY_DN11391_c0_g1_i1.p1 TRINITY_DN11391_c0_g1~~TRINITY_DN11391_c0_g1_i1.p1  ORF type:complete len:516 (-),score=122.57 TRINITY_DN11391_c0_g1_i1:292-1839(-)
MTPPAAKSGKMAPPALEEVDVDVEEAQSLTRQSSLTSEDCRLVACTAPSPTSADPIDAPKLDFEQFRQKTRPLVREFFCAQDIQGMIASVAALGCSCFHDELVALLIRTSLDHKDAEREIVVELLTALHNGNYVTTPQLVRGFEKLVLSWEDIRLDVPQAPGRLVALLSDRVGLLDKNLFARLPEGLLRALLDELPVGVSRVALSSHLEDLLAFKSELSQRVRPLLDGEVSLGEFEAWLGAAQKAAFHHEVVLAVALCTWEGLTAPEDADAGDKALVPAFVLERRKRSIDLFVQLRHGSEERLLHDEDLQLGFSRLLGVASAIEKQGLDAKELLVGLLRGAIEHEVLAAEFLKTARRLRFGGPLGVQVVKETQRQTPMYCRRVWGTGDDRQFRSEVNNAIAEYFDSRNINELARIVGELHLSEGQQVDFVRKIFLQGMERGESTCALDAVEYLVGYYWTSTEVEHAFDQLRSMLGDLVLDYPRCREHTTDLMWAAAGRGLLHKSYLPDDTPIAIV